LLPSAWAAPQKPDGAELWKKQGCQMCHAPDGKGFPAIHTPDFTDPKVQANLTDRQIADAIKNGKPNTAMKPFGDKLNSQEIQALVIQIRAFNNVKSAGYEKRK
jgi:cytochrome c553